MVPVEYAALQTVMRDLDVVMIDWCYNGCRGSPIKLADGVDGTISGMGVTNFANFSVTGNFHLAKVSVR